MVVLLLVVHLDHHALALDFVLLEVDIHTKYRGMKFWYLLQYSAYKKKIYLSHSFIQWFIDAVASVIIFFQQISQDKRLNFASIRLKNSIQLLFILMFKWRDIFFGILPIPKGQFTYFLYMSYMIGTYENTIRCYADTCCPILPVSRGK